MHYPVTGPLRVCCFVLPSCLALLFSLSRSLTLLFFVRTAVTFIICSPHPQGALPNPALRCPTLPCAISVSVSFISQGLGINLPAAGNLFTCHMQIWQTHSQLYSIPYHTPFSSWPGAGQGPSAARVNAAFLGEIITAVGRQLQLEFAKLHIEILLQCGTGIASIMCVSPCSTHPFPLSNHSPCLEQLRSANLTIFGVATDWGHLALQKLLSNYFVSCGNVATGSTAGLGAVTGLASLAPCNLRWRRREIEKNERNYCLVLHALQVAARG